MNEKKNLIEELDKLLNFKDNISSEDREILIKVRNELNKAKSKNQMRRAMVPLLRMIHFLKEIIDLFSG